MCLCKMVDTINVDIEYNCHSINLNELPIEILTEIFDLLELLDRKKARLVCRMWFDLANTERFSRKEKLVCRKFHDLDVIFQIVKNSQREILNLEFQCTHFDHFSSSSSEF